ncbi:hypothetical protein TNCV_4779561 [Trichonephila clavipes]|nr:hypothetical protein TNCV_4779561 [Trichonephila clavipes]
MVALAVAACGFCIFGLLAVAGEMRFATLHTFGVSGAELGAVETPGIGSTGLGLFLVKWLDFNFHVTYFSYIVDVLVGLVFWEERRRKSGMDIIKMGRTILLERRQSESVGRRNSRTTFLRSDWPRPFARREVGVEMELGRSENKRPEQRRS